MSNETQTIGFIGLGAMGMGAACSLVRAGFQVKGFDLRAEVLASFADAGGIGVTTVAEAAQDSDIFILMVVNAEQAEDVLFGAGRAVDALPAGAVVMLCCTVKPNFARELHARLAEHELLMLDSPISGGPVRAADGTMTIMASGPSTVFAKIDHVLEAMAANVFRMGEEPGLGSTMKAINQLLAGVHIATAAEAIAFGAKAGIDPKDAFDVISVSAGNSWMFENRVPHILADDYSPLSAIDIWVKDLGIVLETGKENRFPLPLAAAATPTLHGCVCCRHGAVG